MVVALLSSLRALDECLVQEMLAVLRRIELAKLALMHLLEILHTKQDSVHAVCMLMQSVQTTPAPTWVEQMHLAVPKKVQSAQSGSQLVNLMREIQQVCFGKIVRLSSGD
jgi:hypothetical protein